MTMTENGEEIKRPLQSASLKATSSVLPVDVSLPPSPGRTSPAKKPLGPHNATSQVHKDDKDTTKRRVSLDILKEPLSSGEPIPPSLQSVSGPSSQENNKPTSLSQFQVEIPLDQETKGRRASSVATSQIVLEAAALPLPPKQLIVPPTVVAPPPSPSPSRGQVRLSPNPSTEMPQTGTSRIEKDGETKRRMSASSRQIDAIHKVTPPRGLVVVPSTAQKETVDSVFDKKPSPVSGNNPSPIPPSCDSLIVPSPPSIASTRESVSVAFPKARMTPPRSPSVTMNSLPSNDRRPLPLLPSAGEMERRGGVGDRKHHRLSLPPSSPQRSGSVPYHQLGQRKQQQRISLPNASALATTAAVTNSPIGRRLGERKQRVSLPPSSSLSSATTTAPAPAPALAQAPAQSSADSDSETERGVNLPVKHRLGERKQRVSLPPFIHASDSPDRHRLGDRKLRASMPPSIPGQRTSTSETTAVASDPVLPRHRQLGEKKSNRLSLPNNTAATASLEAMQPSAASTTCTEEETKEEVPVDVEAAEAEATTCDSSSLASNSKSSSVPQKGLRNNSTRQPPPSLAVPNLAGPGAFFVPGDALTAQDVEQRTSFRRQSISNQDIEHRTSFRSNASASDLMGIEQRSSFRRQLSSCSNSNKDIIELQNRGSFRRMPSSSTISTLPGSSRELRQAETAATSSSTNFDGDISIEVAIDIEEGRQQEPIRQLEPSRENPTSDLAPPQNIIGGLASRPCSEAGSPRRKSKQTEVEPVDDSEPPKTKCLFKAQWCCSIVVPLILAAAFVAVITTVVKSLKKGNDTNLQTSAPSADPTVRLFDDEALAPSFTLAALKDPKSPQSKAREWLLADPNASSYTQARKVQRFALATIYAANGARWKNSTHWLSYDHDECSWFSSHVNATTICNQNMEYTHLALASNSMRGTLPPEVSLLTALLQISLSSNKLYGQIPSELGTLTRLSILDLSQNSFTGPIPTELGQLSDQLAMLLLRENKLSGAVPTELAHLRRLEELHLTDNALTSTIPPVFGRLDQLRTLRLGRNKLSGPIPSQLGLLQQLNMLNVGANQLTGVLPSEFGALSFLTFLGVAQLSRLNATIPTELGRLTNLETFFATSSGIRGRIPPQIGSMTSLQSLSLASNRLSGPLPSVLGHLTNIQWLYLYDNNRLTGALPTEIGKMSGLKILHAFVTQLDSSIPSELGKLTDMTDLQIFGTMISGTLPSELANLSKLEELAIKNTDLSGGFPSAICQLSESQQLTITADCSKMVCCGA